MVTGSPACKEEKLPEYKDRATPTRAALLFRYAIENDCLDLALDVSHVDVAGLPGVEFELDLVVGLHRVLGLCLDRTEEEVNALLAAARQLASSR